jgi:putative phage-type endonuclease
MTAVEILAVADPADPAWHAARRRGVSASEIAAVLGLSPYESPFSLYWRKRNGWQTDDNEFMSAGRLLEEPIAQWWQTEHGDPAYLTTTHAGLYAHPDRPWQMASPDRLIIDIWGKDVALLECKWVAYSWDGWGEDGTSDVPVHYRAQCLWQMDVMGVDTVYVAALGPGGFRAFTVRRDEKDLKAMRAAGARFWEDLRAGRAPDVDGSMATLDTLKRLHPDVGTEPLEVSVELAETYRRARALRKRADQLADSCEARLRALLGSDYGRAVVGKKLVASRSVYAQPGDMAELDSLDTDHPVVDRLTPGRATTYR